MAHVATVTIKASKVPADLTDFPVFVRLSDFDGAFWNSITASGGDIRCYKSDGTTELAREIIDLDRATRRGGMYIKFAGTLSSSVDTEIQIHTDGTSSEPAVTATYGRNNVWTGFDAVYHLHQDPSGGSPQLTDATGNGYNQTSNGSMTSGDLVTGKLGFRATQFDGSNDYYNVASGSSLDAGNEDVHVSMWFKLDSTAAAYGIATKNAGTPAAAAGYHAYNSGTTMYSKVADGTTAVNGQQSGLNTSDWFLFNMEWDDSAGTLATYMNTNTADSDSGSVGSMTNTGTTFQIGARGGSLFAPASIQEVRVRRGSSKGEVLGENWHDTQFANENDPTSFYSITRVNSPKYAINDTDVLNNCVSWWPLNEYSSGGSAVTRYDAHGTNHLTDVATTASALGAYNRAAQFVKTDSNYLTVADNASLSITGSLTIVAMVKHDTLPSSGGQQNYVLKTDGTATGESYFFKLYNNGGTLQLYGQVRQNSGSGLTSIFSNWTPTAGVWYQVALVYDASAQTLKTYVDGAQVGSTVTSAVTSIQDTGASFFIGDRAAGSEEMNGCIQDVSLHSAALTGTQLTRLYNSGDFMTYGIDYDYGTGSFNNSHSKGTSHTYQHKADGVNPIVLVGVMASTAGSITGVTYGGQAMTEIDTYATAIAGLFVDQTLWALKAPPAGDNTVSVQTTGSGTMYLYTAAHTYIGVDQTTGYVHTGKNRASSTTVTLSIDTSGAPSTDDCWLAGVAFSNGNYSLTAGAGTRKRNALAGIDNWLGAIDQYTPINPAGSDSLVANIATSSEIQIIGVSLKPVSAGTAYTMVAAVGSFALTGIAAAFQKAWTMVAAVGSFTLTGIAVTFARGKGFVASVGSFTLTSQDTAFRKAISMTAAAGSFTLTGVASGFTRGVRLVASVGTFVLDGIAAALKTKPWGRTGRNTGIWTRSNKNDDE